MALAPGSCPGGYNWYVCAGPAYTGCCAVDACSALRCPPGSEYVPGSTAPGSTTPGSTAPPITPTGVTLPPTGTAQSGSSIAATVRGSPTSKTISKQIITASSTQQSDTASSTQQSDPASPTKSSATSSGHSSSPLLSIIAISVGGVVGILIIVLIIILYRRRRRRRKSVNPAGGLSTHGGVPEPSLDDGPVTAERAGVLAFFKRNRPLSVAKTTTVLTSSPSTTHPELPSPSFPSEHNSVIPGMAELPISSVSELSSADRGVYSSTNVSTASTSAVVSPMPHETLRGGGRPVMMPNMVPAGRERRKHALSWQSFEPGDGQ